MSFVRLNRSFFENAYWKQKRTFSSAEAWLDLIQSARFEAEPTTILLSNNRHITIKRGELRASLRYLSERWGWGVEKVKNFLDRHIKLGEIERRTEQGESLIMLCNYERYNQTPNADPYTNQYSDTTATSTKKKKGKKSKDGEEDTPPLPPSEDWRSSYEVYLSELREVYSTLKKDKSFMAQCEKYHPSLDIQLSLEKACVEYWATEAGWKKKRQSRTSDIDWKRTLTNALNISSNKVYKPLHEQRKETTTGGTYVAGSGVR